MSESTQSKHENVNQQHEELRELLGVLARKLAGRQGTRQELVGDIVSLQEHVVEHFIEEEDHGFFDGVIAQAPRLANRARTVKTEHKPLKHQIEMLSESAQDLGNADWWNNVERGFREFSRELMHHESRENELLAEAYGDDIGAAD